MFLYYCLFSAGSLESSISVFWIVRKASFSWGYCTNREIQRAIQSLLRFEFSPHFCIFKISFSEFWGFIYILGWCQNGLKSWFGVVVSFVTPARRFPWVGILTPGLIVSPNNVLLLTFKGIFSYSFALIVSGIWMFWMLYFSIYENTHSFFLLAMLWLPYRALTWGCNCPYSLNSISWRELIA